MVKRIEKLTPEQEARFGEWVERWTAVGLSTEPLDMAKFEPAARACYRYAGLPEPKVVISVPSPMVMAFAAPMAGRILADEAVRNAPDEASRAAAIAAIPSAELRSAVSSGWYRYIGGQMWVGGWWWLGSPSAVSFLREVCGLELNGDMMDRALAYQATVESACWWYPHSDFIMVSDRPLHIKRDDQGRLHAESGPAIVWRDGFGVYSWHGVVVPADVIDTPAADITAERITGERNAEVRRVLIERLGVERYIAKMGATKVATDDWGTLWKAERPGDEPLMAVELLNSTPEPDGTTKTYWIRVPGTDERRESDACVVCGTDLAIVPKTPHQAVAWGYSLCAADYRPAVMT